MTVTSLMSADELLHLPDDGNRYELVQGELRKMSPPGADHGGVAAAIIISLGRYDRKSGVWGKSVDLGGRRIINKNKKEHPSEIESQSRDDMCHLKKNGSQAGALPMRTK